MKKSKKEEINAESLQERPRYAGKLLLAFFIGTAIFILVFFLGYMVSYYKLQSTIQSQEDLRYQLLSFQIEERLLDNSCEHFDANRFSSERNRLSGILTVLEERLGKDNPGVIEQKKTYAVLEAQHFLYIKNHNELCNNTLPTILFFYSNLGSDRDVGEKLGYMLTTLNNKRPDVMVYSFDYDIDSSLISLLKEKYKVVKPNLLVINERTPLNVFNSMADIEALL